MLKKLYYDGKELEEDDGEEVQMGKDLLSDLDGLTQNGQIALNNTLRKRRLTEALNESKEQLEWEAENN